MYKGLYDHDSGYGRYGGNDDLKTVVINIKSFNILLFEKMSEYLH